MRMMSRKGRAKDYVGSNYPCTSGHWFRKKLIDSVVSSDEALINQVLPDEEELKNGRQARLLIGTSPPHNDDKRGGSQDSTTKKKTAEWGESNYWCQAILIEFKLFCTRRSCVFFHDDPRG